VLDLNVFFGLHSMVYLCCGTLHMLFEVKQIKQLERRAWSLLKVL
jgi:hypothetical protein